MSYEFFESRGLTVASVTPNPHTKLNTGCMLVIPTDVHDRVKQVGILRLQNRTDEITPQTLVDLLSPESELRFPAAAYLHNTLEIENLGNRAINIVYFPHETRHSEVSGKIRIETALISVRGYAPHFEGQTTVVYHRGKPLMSVNGTGGSTDITTDGASLASLHDALKAILQPPLAQVKSPTLLRYTDRGALRYLVEPSQIFS